MSYDFGTSIHLKITGSSHGCAVGIEMDGLPIGERLDLDALQEFLDRRRPSNDVWSTKRHESDALIVDSGIDDGVITGNPILAHIANCDAKPEDYQAASRIPRPGHADLGAFFKYGLDYDATGGGRFSGRMTSALCIAGGIAKQLLENNGIHVGAHVSSIGGIEDERFSFDTVERDISEIAKKAFPVINDDIGSDMVELMKAVANEGDSIGGSVECVVVGVPNGIGGELFEGIEGELARSLFAIPAVKGVEFGAGFSFASMRGSVANDPIRMIDGKPSLATNNCGGILGGISVGAPIVVNVAFKPTPSISLLQNSVDLNTMENTTLRIEGRHDSCFVSRAVPVVEAVVAMTLLDILSSGEK